MKMYAQLNFYVVILFQIVLIYSKMENSNRIMLASSGANNEMGKAKQKCKLKSDISQIGIEKNPLSGVNIDVLHFKEMHPNGKVIISTKYVNKLKSKEDIKTSIYNSFNGDRDIFFFTGHGNFSGGMMIQTKQQPDGEILLLEEIYDLWLLKMSHQDGIKCLSIYLDCCFAGKMLARLKNKRKQTNQLHIIEVFGSSGPNDTSYDLLKYGGLLVCNIWSHYYPDYLLKKQKQELKQKFHSKNPVKLSSPFSRSNWNNIELNEWK